jgi:hypothetical protein
MIKSHKESGSALAVISIVGVVLILAGLGFIFWQNSIGKPTVKDSTQSANKTTSTVKLKEGKVDASFPSPFSWSYPETWSIETTGGGPVNAGETSVQNFNITSPSGKYTVSYRVAVEGGIGGSCDPSESEVQYVRQEPIASFENGRFVEFIGDYNNTVDTKKEFLGYYYRSEINDNTDAVRQAKIGSSYCVFGLSAVQLSGKMNYTLLGASISIKDLGEIVEGAPMRLVQDVDSIKKAFDTSEYKEAVEILLSTKYSGQ